METLVNSNAARKALGLSRIRCTSPAKTTGEKCTRWAILGGFVCPMHGGAQPVVKEAAKARLLQIAEPAAYAMQMVVLDLTAEWERAMGLDDAPRVAHLMSLAPSIIRAATAVLDRCGFSPAMKLEIATPNPFDGLSLAEIADKAEEFAREARATADAEAQLRLGDGTTVEGVVIKEDR
jgi:hypothetical protein